MSNIITKSIIFSILLIIAYVPSAISQELTYTSIRIKPYDGRKNNRGNWLGAWVYLSGLKIDGKKAIKSRVGFEISGDFPITNSVDRIGFSSKQTFSEMPAVIATKKNDDNLGGRFWVRAGSNESARYRKLSGEDALIFKGICGMLADDAFTNYLIGKLANAKPFSYSNYVDDKYNKFWQRSSRVRELKNIANDCNRAARNNGSNKIAFVDASQSVSLGTTSVCG